MCYVVTMVRALKRYLAYTRIRSINCLAQCRAKASDGQNPSAGRKNLRAFTFRAAMENHRTLALRGIKTGYRLALFIGARVSAGRHYHRGRHFGTHHNVAA